MDQAELELKTLAKAAAVKLNEQEICRSELLNKAEAELLAVRESTAGLRSAAEHAVESLAGIGQIKKLAETYARAAEVSRVTRRLLFFTTELKKMKLIFPESQKEDQLPLDVAVRFAKALQPLLLVAPDLTGISLVAQELANLQKHGNSLAGRFARELRSAVKTGNQTALAESLVGLKIIGNPAEEVNRFTDEIVNQVKKQGSVELINAAAQVALLSAAVNSVEPSRVFWQKTLARRPEPKYYALCREAREVVEQVLLLQGSELEADQLVPQV